MRHDGLRAGQARKPGAYTVSGVYGHLGPRGQRGGPNQNGSLRRVQVKAQTKLWPSWTCMPSWPSGDKAADIKLQDGDTVFIPAAKGYVAMVGKVRTPAVRTKADDTIDSMLAVAGGLPVMVDLRATLSASTLQRTRRARYHPFARGTPLGWNGN